MRSVDIRRLEDGCLAGHWGELHTLDLFTQVGAVQVRAASAA